jgi:hypothetical protein
MNYCSLNESAPLISCIFQIFLCYQPVALRNAPSDTATFACFLSLSCIFFQSLCSCVPSVLVWHFRSCVRAQFRALRFGASHWASV